nr:hypothetical protein [Hafnia alvei]
MLIQEKPAKAGFSLSRTSSLSFTSFSIPRTIRAISISKSLFYILAVVGMQALQQGIYPLAHRKIGEEYLFVLAHLMKDIYPSFIW